VVSTPKSFLSLCDFQVLALQLVDVVAFLHAQTPKHVIHRESIITIIIILLLLLLLLLLIIIIIIITTTPPPITSARLNRPQGRKTTPEAEVNHAHPLQKHPPRRTITRFPHPLKCPPPLPPPRTPLPAAGDIKPSNILCFPSPPPGHPPRLPTLKLADLGVAREVETTWGNGRTTVVGTELYMAPEIEYGQKTYGPPVDKVWRMRLEGGT
jgi:hypothetical protein